VFETSQYEAFWNAWKATKSVFGSAPDPVGGNHDVSQTPSGWEEENPSLSLPHFPPLDATFLTIK